MADLLPVHAIYEGTNPKYYFRTSDVYGTTGGVSAKVGIKKIADADLEGNEVIVSVKELIRAGWLTRIGIRYKKTGSLKRLSAKILVAKPFLSKVYSENAPDQLEGQSYQVAGVAKGQIVQISGLRRASSY